MAVRGKMHISIRVIVINVVSFISEVKFDLCGPVEATLVSCLYLPERCNGAALQQAHVPVDLHLRASVLPLEQRNRRKKMEIWAKIIYHIEIGNVFFNSTYLIIIIIQLRLAMV